MLITGDLVQRLAIGYKLKRYEYDHFVSGHTALQLVDF
ncbi:hypothetical protein RG47T_0086 [Mucilaginibacter polytrichastri]|uniref:Uncharacterized protein n=1 Tax=Mucilaginibacter polytrichastri TaxID=1302689 RepID=A0A1Q5ZSB0_9SPHI|nr:hypothetical protein RG47T_0086 [Mucilaginibacter polytrichastri]